MPHILHRFVPYGCSFTSDPALRSTCQPLAETALAANEIVVDVGARCWGHALDGRPCEDRIIDHHFDRPSGNFPSASAGVIHLAPRILKYFSSHSFETVWIVTHRQPDFDALCAAYLAAWIIRAAPDAAARFDFFYAGVHPDGWLDTAPNRRINWFEPPLSALSSEHRWMILLASVASHIDECRPLPVSRAVSLPSVLYAGMLRGRDYQTPAAAASFFDSARAAIQAGLNPLYDSVFASSPEYAPELALLSGAPEAYERDLHRASICKVTLPVAKPWEDFFAAVKSIPLLRESAPPVEIPDPGPVHLSTPGAPNVSFDGVLIRDQRESAPPREIPDPGPVHLSTPGAPNVSFDGVLILDQRESAPPVEIPDPDPVHLSAPGAPSASFDGVFIRDPECVLFKDFARDDSVNSPSRQGFIFTAIANSHRKPSPVNSTEYYFSLHPERCDGAHLYHVWAALQAEEIQALYRPEFAALRTSLDRQEQALHTPTSPQDSPAASDQPPESPRRTTLCRPRFEGRAGRLAAYFGDPWFDGHPFKGTIVVSSNYGTRIAPPGTAPDLSDDPIAQRVRSRIALAVFLDRPAEISDIAASAGAVPGSFWINFAGPLTELPLARPGCFRFGVAQVREDSDLFDPGLAPHIGTILWPVLNPDRPHGLPADFKTRHLIVDRHLLAVWSRRGILLACKPSVAGSRATELRALFEELCGLSVSVQTLLGENRPGSPDRVVDLDALLNEVARLRWRMALPENRVLHRFFDAIGFESAVRSVRDVAQSAAAVAAGEEARESRRRTEFVEAILLAIYATELAHILASFFHAAAWNWALFYIAGSTLFVGGAAVYTLVARHGRAARQALGRQAPQDKNAGRWPGWLILAVVLVILAGVVITLWKHPSRSAPPPARESILPPAPAPPHD